MVGKIARCLVDVYLWFLILLFVWMSATYDTIIPLWVSLPLIFFLVAGVVFRGSITDLYADWHNQSKE